MDEHFRPPPFVCEKQKNGFSLVSVCQRFKGKGTNSGRERNQKKWGCGEEETVGLESVEFKKIPISRSEAPNLPPRDTHAYRQHDRFPFNKYPLRELLP